MGEITKSELSFQELSKPILPSQRCGCGKRARYYYQAEPYVSDIIYSCNGQRACLTYAELTTENAHISERIRWVLRACEMDRDARNELEALVESEGK